MFPSARLATNLEKLNADLPSGCVQPIQLLCRSNNHALHIIARLTVGNNNNVQRLCIVQIRLASAEIRRQDLIQALASRGTALRPYAAKDFANCGGGGDVVE